MPKAKEPEPPKIGRPSMYDEDKAIRGALLSSAEGATDDAIARHVSRELGETIGPIGIREWYDPRSTGFKPAFARAVAQARDVCADAVEGCLYRRSIFQVIEDETETIERVEPPSGKAARARVESFIDDEGLITKHSIVRTKRTLPPSDASMAMYLVNRRKQRWQHVTKIEVTPGDGGPVPYDQLTPGERAQLAAEAAAFLAIDPGTRSLLGLPGEGGAEQPGE